MLTDGTIEEASQVLPGALYNSNVDIYMCHTNGIPAKDLGDTVYYKIYAKLADGSYVYSELGSYSAVDHAKSVISGNSDQSRKDLATELMNYGTAAQLFFNYNTDDLMNSFLTEE